jgi:hypothetical protein
MSQRALAWALLPAGGMLRGFDPRRIHFSAIKRFPPRLSGLRQRLF